MTDPEIVALIIVGFAAVYHLFGYLFPPVKPLEKLYTKDKRKWLVTQYPINPDMPMPGLMPVTLDFAEEMVRNYPERCRIEER